MNNIQTCYVFVTLYSGQREWCLLHGVHHVSTVAHKDKPNSGSREGLFAILATNLGGW